MLLGFLSSFSIIKIRLQKTARKTYVEIKRKRIKRTKKMKILGVPVLTVAIIGGLVYWITKKSP